MIGAAGRARTTAPRGKVGRPGHDLDAVLLVAAKTFTERGYDRTSMEDLARRLGVTKSAIYHHVSGKDELLRLATDRALDGLAAVVEEAAAIDGPAIDRLEHAVRRSVELLVDELPFVTLLLRVRGNTLVEKRAIARRRQIDHALAALVAKAEAEGDVRDDVDPELAARLLFGTVNSLVEWYRPARGGTRKGELADVVCRIAFTGLRT
ncbi:MAG: TetR/AcrR family transcriptional regulator [Jatrophihabitantaceae bacterium]